MSATERWTAFRITFDAGELIVRATRPDPTATGVRIDYVRDAASGADVTLTAEQAAQVEGLAVAGLNPPKPRDVLAQYRRPWKDLAKGIVTR